MSPPAHCFLSHRKAKNHYRGRRRRRRGRGLRRRKKKKKNDDEKQPEEEENSKFYSLLPEVPSFSCKNHILISRHLAHLLILSPHSDFWSLMREVSCVPLSGSNPMEFALVSPAVDNVN